MAAQKVYSIQINGLTESVKAVDALNESLKNLESRIKALEGKSVKVGVSSSGGGSKSSSTSSLSEEEKLEKQIAQLEEKRIAHTKQIYQNYLAAKDVLSETEKVQKSNVASGRLAAKSYSNTIAGMKQELADIKSAMQTVDLGDTDQFDKMAQRAKELNDKLKEIEQSYGQFSRNVGNYSSAFDGMQKLSINIGGVTREFNSAREASKTLKNELIGLEAAGSGNTEVAKELRSEYYKLQSAMDDATKSSKAMDEAMDYMQSFTAMASVGNGLQAFFGFDESEIQKSIQRLVALQNVLQGIETIRKQMETGEGFGKIFGEGNKAIDTFVSNITGAQIGINGLTTASKAGTVAVRALSVALKGVGIGIAIAAISYAVEGLQKLISSLDTTKAKEEALEREANALNRIYEERKSILSGSFMSGAISAEEYLKEQYKLENEYIQEQINLLRERASIENDRSWWYNEFSPSGEYNTGATGQRITGNTSVGSWNQISNFQYDVKSVEEAEEAWKKLNEAVKHGNDYFTEYGEGFGDWISSILVNVSQTEDVLKGMGNIVLSDLIGDFEELNGKFNDGEISAEDFAKGLKELTDRMNSSEVLNSVIANLEDYIPDEEARKKIENIITYLRRLNNEFNIVSEAQVHRWNQVRIDAMEDGAEKIAAQMAEDERHEIAQFAHTEEQKQLIQAKYQRKRIDETKKHNKKVSQENKKNRREELEAEKDLANLRIANMKEGLNKVLKQLEEERKQRLKKVEADGILVGERQAEINKFYNKKIEDAQREHAENVRKTYKNMWDNIYAYSLETQNKIVENTRQEFENQSQLLEYGRSKTFGDKQKESGDISSYGIQGTNQLSKGTQIELQVQEQNTKKLRETYDARLEIIEAYWKERTELTLKSENKLRGQENEQENQSFRREMTALNDHYKELEGEVKKGLSAGTLVEEDAEKIRERNRTEFQKREKALVNEHNNNLLQIQQNSLNKMQGLTAEYYRERLQELRDLQTAISNLEAKQPVFNSWGIINLAETKKNNENLLDSYRVLSNEIVTLKRKLQTQLDKNEISFDDFQNANRELDAFADNVGQRMDEVKHKLTLGEQIGSFISSINQYVQTGLQAVQTVMQALNDYQDYQFEKEQEMLDKENEMLQEKLDKQQEIVEEHKNNIESIEDELANSRGDRRQHLIDQLNAEMEAQRRAQKEEENIQKKKDANEKKQEALEKKRREAEYKRNLLSILVSTAMATANGLATKPFVPVGIAMGALATTLGMVQYALAAKAKPYRVGGQLEGGLVRGKRHSQGGVPVGNTGIEVEGDEMIIRRESTMPNIDVLNFINKSQRRLNIDDFIDFYSSGKVKKNIMNMSPKAKYSDGGYLPPTLSTNIELDDRLLDAFERYASKPSVVQVVDIINKTDDINKVKVLAGLK